jgi:hypothetical protein
LEVIEEIAAEVHAVDVAPAERKVDIGAGETGEVALDAETEREDVPEAATVVVVVTDAEKRRIRAAVKFFGIDPKSVPHPVVGTNLESPASPVILGDQRSSYE